MLAATSITSGSTVSLDARHMANMVARERHRIGPRIQAETPQQSDGDLMPSEANQQRAPGGGTDMSTRYLAATSSTHWLPWNTTVCWVPSKVNSAAPSCLARSTPA